MNKAHWRLVTADSQPNNLTGCRQSTDGPAGLKVFQQSVLSEDQEQVAFRLLTGDKELT